MVDRRVLHYEVQEKIGAGGMGVVHKALDTKLKRTVALKFLSGGLAADPEQRQRFIREAMAASSLDHPNICTIYEINEAEDGQLFLAMAYYPGETLSQMLRGGPLSLERTLAIAIQVARALERAHQHGVTHRDIKPANIMFTKGMVKVLDFGLAKLADDAGLTREGEAMGTVRYMSPEQATGKFVDPRTDIWAMGAVFYEMLTGVAPFVGATSQGVLHAILTQAVTPIAPQFTNVPPEVDWIIAKALAKNTKDRYAQISEMLADLEAIREHRQPSSASGSSVSKPLDAAAMAVLPFENLGGDKENEYFSDGLTEEVINALSQVKGLRVVSRTSSFEFKGKAQDIRKIGEVLKVQSLLEGSVRSIGNRLRVTAQLTDVATGYHVWSHRYDREVSDVFEIQDQISAAIVEALKLALPLRTEHSPASHAETNMEAYQMCLKGRFYWNKKTPAGLEKAQEFFESALAEDADCALAYSGLADTYTLMAGYGLAPPCEMWPKAKAAALKAIAANPELPEPHAALGSVLTFYDRNWAEAEMEFRKALELRPQFAEAHLRYGFYFMATGRLEQALRRARTAHQLDPLSAATTAAETMVLTYMGRCEAAIRRCKEALEMHPYFIELRYVLGMAYQRLGKFDEAIAAFEAGATISGREPLFLCWLGAAYADAGRRDQALGILEELKQREKEGGPPLHLPFAVVHTALGHKDAAFERLFQAADAFDGLVCYIQIVPTYDSLRDDSRYLELLTRLGMTPVGEPTATLHFSEGAPS